MGFLAYSCVHACCELQDNTERGLQELPKVWPNASTVRASNAAPTVSLTTQHTLFEGAVSATADALNRKLVAQVSWLPSLL